MQTASSFQLESGRRVRFSHLDDGEGLWERIGLLRREEQMLLELALKAGASQRQIGHLMQCPAGSVSRRLRGIGRRLHDPLVVALLDERCPLEPTYRQIGVEHFLVRMSSAEIAHKHDLPRARVLRVIHLVQLWWREVRGGK